MIIFEYGKGLKWMSVLFSFVILSMLLLPKPSLAEPSESVKIIDFSKVMKDGKLVVSAKVENGAVPGEAGMVAIGYDAEGHPLETGSSSASMSGHESKTLIVALQHFTWIRLA